MSNNWGFFGSQVGEPLFPDPLCEICEGTGYRFKVSKIYCECLRPPADDPHGGALWVTMPEHAFTYDVVYGKAFRSPEFNRAQMAGKITLCCEREVCSCGENLRLVDAEPVNLPGRTLRRETPAPEQSPLPFPGRYGRPD